MVLAVDTSAIFAVLVEEPGFESILSCVDTATRLLIGTPTLVEAGIIVETKGVPGGLNRIRGLLHLWEIEIVDFKLMHAVEAWTAYQRFGKGRHSARLNMGDCQSYAIAKVAGCPLLYKGNDFTQTDLPKLDSLLL